MSNFINGTAGQMRPSGALIGVNISNGTAVGGDVSVSVNNAGNFKSKSHLRTVILEILDLAAQNAGLK